METEFRAEFDEKIDESEQKMMSLNGELTLWVFYIRLSELRGNLISRK